MGGCKEKGHPLAFFKEKQEVFAKWELGKDIQGNVNAGPMRTRTHTLHLLLLSRVQVDSVSARQRNKKNFFRL